MDSRLTIEDNDTIGKVGGHDEIVLDDESGLLGVHDETLDDTGSNDTLLGVEVGTGLIDQVDVGRHTQSQDDSNTLQLTTRQVLDLLVDEVVHLEWLVDISLELGAQEGSLDLLEEELADGTLELGCNCLGLHGDAHLGDLGGAVRLNSTSKHLTEGGLSGTVLTHHDDDLGVVEVSSLDVQREITLGPRHLRVAVVVCVVDHKLLTSLSNAELQRLFTETQVLGGDVTVQEDVDTFTDRLWECDNTVDSWLSVENADEIGEVVENGQIVLDADDVVVRAKQAANLASGSKTLLDVQERGRLVEHVHVGLLHADKGDGETLEFSTREQVDLTVEDVPQLKVVEHLLQVVHLRAGADELSNGPFGALDSLGDLVDILRLDDSLQVVLEDLGEVVWESSAQERTASHVSVLTLQLRSTEVLQDLLPVGRVVVASQVGLELATEDLERGTLANTVCANETQHLSRTGHGQPVQLEAVGRVSVGDLGLEVGGQVDDVDGVEGAFLGADTATNTQALGDEGDLGGRVDFNAELARADHGARLLALLPAFLRPVSARTGNERDLCSPSVCTVVTNTSR